MKKTLRVIPYLDDERPVDRQEFYKIELDILLDSTELTDVSYIVSELSKATVQIEKSLDFVNSLNAKKEQQHDK